MLLGIQHEIVHIRSFDKLNDESDLSVVLLDSKAMFY